MFIKRYVRMAEYGNLSIAGLRGRGKDMLMGNIIVRINRPYISNVVYDDKGLCIPWEYAQLDIRNSYHNFVTGKFNYYKFPYEDGTHIYLSDCGNLFPAQFCNDLNKRYQGFVPFLALSRQLGLCNVIQNAQNFNRVWDKIREQSDQYLYLRWCKVFFGKLVVMKLTEYDQYEAFCAHVKPFSVEKPSLLNRDKGAEMQWRLARDKFKETHGEVHDHLCIFVNKSVYNTRQFKYDLEGGEKNGV